MSTRTALKIVIAAALVAAAAVAGYVWVPQLRQQAQLARERDELEYAVGLGKVAALRQFVSEHPQSPLCEQALRTIDTLLRDDTCYERAASKGTAEALDGFLADFPGHVREPDAHALRERMNPRNLFELLAAQQVEIEAAGSDITGVQVTLRRRTPYELNVIVPVGTFFVAQGDCQNMVATHEATVRLATDDPREASIPAACANRSRPVPGIADRFGVELAPSQQELRALVPQLERAGAGTAVTQAAVWIVTDDADYADLGLLVVTQGFGSGGSRAIDEAAAATALKLCADAGLDLSARKISADVFVLVHGLAVQEQGVSEWCRAQLERSGLGRTAGEIVLTLLERSEDEGMFAHALAVVKKLGSTAVRPGLLGLARSASAHTRRRAAEALGGLADPGDFESLVGLANDPDAEVRAAALRALYVFNAPAKVSTFAGALADVDEDVVLAALAGLSEVHDPVLVPALIRVTQGPLSATVRANATRVLGEFDGIAVHAELVRLLADEDDEVAEATLWGLSRARDPSLVPAFLAVLQTERPGYFRAELVRSLDKVGGAEVRPELVRLLDDQDELVVQSALEALSDVHDPALAPVFIGLLQGQRPPYLQEQATRLLAALGGAEVRAELLRLAGHAQGLVRAAAAEALGNAAEPGDLQLLIGLTRDGDGMVRTAAVAALRSYTGPEKLATLARALTDESEEVASAALAGLAGVRDRTLVPALAEALRRERSEFFRTPALDALAEIGGSEATAALVRLLDGPDVTPDRSDIVDRIGAIGDPTILPKLEDLLVREKDDTVKEALSRAMGWIRTRSGVSPPEKH